MKKLFALPLILLSLACGVRQAPPGVATSLTRSSVTITLKSEGSAFGADLYLVRDVGDYPLHDFNRAYVRERPYMRSRGAETTSKRLPTGGKIVHIVIGIFGERDVMAIRPAILVEEGAIIEVTVRRPLYMSTYRVR